MKYRVTPRKITTTPNKSNIKDEPREHKKTKQARSRSAVYP